MECLNCHANFIENKKALQKGKRLNSLNGRFCSFKCSYIYRSECRKKIYVPNRTCKLCGKEFYRSDYKVSLSKSGLTFCSKVCRDRAQTKAIGILRLPHYKYIKVLRYCFSCNKVLPSRRWLGKFCSVACQHDAAYKSYIERWFAGKEKGVSGMGVSLHIKRWLREKSADKCMKCGWSLKHTITKKVPLTVNHIDGNWKNCRPDNLEMICPNCHSLTPTFGGLNRGKGRTERYKKLPV